MPDDIKLPEPVAWTLREYLATKRTATRVFLWFNDPANSVWVGLYTADQVSAALEAERATITEDMKSAVRWAPSSAHWSERLREFFGPDAREGIAALERQLREARAAVEAGRARRVPLTDEQVQEVITGIGNSVLELAKRWDDGDINSYSLALRVKVLAAAIVRRTEAAHGITETKGGSDA